MFMEFTDLTIYLNNQKLWALYNYNVLLKTQIGLQLGDNNQKVWDAVP